MRTDDLGKLTLRLTVGGLMLFHGIYKIQNGVSFIEGMLIEEGFPAWIANGVYVAEVVAPILIILGWGARLAATAIMIDMLAALMLVHANEVLSVSARGGAWAVELPMFFLMSSLAIVIMGSGAFSLSAEHVSKQVIIRTPKGDRIKQPRYPTPPTSPTVTY